MRNFLIAALLTLCLLGFAHRTRADSVIVPSASTFQEMVPGHSGLRWGEVVRTFLPDAHASADNGLEGTDLVEFRHIDGQDAYTKPPDNIHITALTARDILEQGKKRLLVLADIGPPDGALGMALLALIDPSPKPRLLDIVDVAADKENYLDESVKLKIARGSDLIVTLSTHLNAGEEFVISYVIVALDDRLTKLAEVPSHSYVNCRYELKQTRSFSIVANPRAKFDSLLVTEHEQVKHLNGGCDADEIPKAGIATSHTLYRWDQRKGVFTALRGP
jgi:hypothetical protein